MLQLRTPLELQSGPIKFNFIACFSLVSGHKLSIPCQQHTISEARTGFGSSHVRITWHKNANNQLIICAGY